MLKKFTSSLGILILLLVFINPAFAEIHSVEMQVDGMTCPFCVYGIEKKLEALREVQEASANLKKATVDIKLKNNEPIDIRRLNDAVRESGFTPGRIQIKAAGKLTDYNLEGRNQAALEVTGPNQLFLLISTPNHGKEEFLSDEKLNEVEKATGGGKKEITITGYIHSHPEGFPPALSVESFESK
ncbi:MAG: heavy-metal-associated domain-containing protein [Thermodesulfobacteriota bacterium]